MSTQQAAEYVIHKEVASLKDGEGGVIVLDTRTAPVWSFNTSGYVPCPPGAGSAD
jgi:isoaspartyl peptidase/L-asparaginase-like protein (Ntn-hydrolase superfamily)